MDYVLGLTVKSKTEDKEYKIELYTDEESCFQFSPDSNIEDKEFMKIQKVLNDTRIVTENLMNEVQETDNHKTIEHIARGIELNGYYVSFANFFHSDKYNK